ncbi:hypothetical protein TNCV_3681241 [Trichonephila clavipes]|uniref:Uncharacterized protein n=1 Tax=Trichonephila clavipes TaxID=2585209 RepID=A0A8X6RAQ4_TRICX|nr:hypothetical protein TNCV_3681241 [Trichonephila clavipes]
MVEKFEKTQLCVSGKSSDDEYTRQSQNEVNVDNRLLKSNDDNAQLSQLETLLFELNTSSAYIQLPRHL